MRSEFIRAFSVDTEGVSAFLLFDTLCPFLPGLRKLWRSSDRETATPSRGMLYQRQQHYGLMWYLTSCAYTVIFRTQAWSLVDTYQVVAIDRPAVVIGVAYRNLGRPVPMVWEHLRFPPTRWVSVWRQNIPVRFSAFFFQWKRLALKARDT